MEALEVSSKRHWSECSHEHGVFARIMVGLAARSAEHRTIMIDVSRRTPCVRVSLRKFLKAHSTTSSLRAKKGRGRQIGRTKGGMNTKLHAVADARGRLIGFFMLAGQVSDYTGAAAMLGSLPKADWILADRGYDADWFREALKDRG